ncbi:hypothetical protein BDZ89DRAFT_1125849 [Hymenopellis radicata]|nr:hypothetical protein BDZ89DRAFT_1125849 [Hymenopellis radicata]
MSDLELQPKHPTLVLVPGTPPAHLSHYEGPDLDHVRRPPSSSDHREDPTYLHASFTPAHRQEGISPSAQTQILTAIIVGSPLIASVVGSCLSVIVADFATSLSEDPHARPARASAVITLLWCSMLTSLGSTMTAVAGLAMSAGYHDNHVGVTKKIVRMLREWKRAGKGLPNHSESSRRYSGVEARPGSPAPTILSAITDRHRDQYAAVTFRAAVVASRLLGLSVGLLSIGLAIYIFLIYPLPVAVIVLVVGVITAIVAATPMLPVLF